MVIRPTKLANIVVFGIILSSLSNYMGARELLPISYIYLDMLLIGVSVLACFMRGPDLARRRNYDSQLQGSLALLAITSALFICIVLLTSLYPNANYEEGGKYLKLSLTQWVLLLSAFYIVFRQGNEFDLRMIGTMAMLLITASVIYEIYNPELFFTNSPGRRSGLFGNPNLTGIVISLLMIVTIDWEKRKDWHNWVPIMLAAITIFMGMSRAAIITVTIVLIMFLYFDRKQKKQGIAVLVVLAMLGVILFERLLEVREFSEFFAINQFQNRLAGLSKLNLQIGDDERITLIKDTLELIYKEPILGYGYAYSYTQVQGPHNMYLRMWLDSGLLGVMAYIAALGILYIYFWRLKFIKGKIYIVALAIYSMFSHNLLESRPLAVMLGILCALAAVRWQERKIEDVSVKQNSRGAIADQLYR